MLSQYECRHLRKIIYMSGINWAMLISPSASRAPPVIILGTGGGVAEDDVEQDDGGPEPPPS